MAQKIYDITANIGKYTDRDGNTKYRSVPVGSLWQGEYGPYMRINRAFNPAGVPCKPEDDSIICNVWEPRSRDGQGGSTPPTASPSLDDDAPF